MAAPLPAALGAAGASPFGTVLRPLLPLFSYDILSTTCAMTKC